MIGTDGHEARKSHFYLLFKLFTDISLLQHFIVSRYVHRVSFNKTVRPEKAPQKSSVTLTICFYIKTDHHAIFMKLKSFDEFMAGHTYPGDGGRWARPVGRVWLGRERGPDRITLKEAEGVVVVSFLSNF